MVPNQIQLKNNNSSVERHPNNGITEPPHREAGSSSTLMEDEELKKMSLKIKRLYLERPNYLGQPCETLRGQTRGKQQLETAANSSRSALTGTIKIPRLESGTLPMGLVGPPPLTKRSRDSPTPGTYGDNLASFRMAITQVGYPGRQTY
jgi:hypothetical protein